jgi:pimeloyl-ACP methyl ester carboxylesterase
VTADIPAVEKGYAPIGDLRMYYEIHGRARAGTPPLVLLHGGGSTIDTSFAPAMRALAAVRQIVAVEQQGHGHTADAHRPFTFTQSADDTAALLRFLRIDRADVLGYSNGGHIALEIALRHRRTVRKLVIQSAMFSRDGIDPGFWDSLTTVTLNDMPAELREAYVKTAPRPDDLPTFFTKSVRRMREFRGWTADEIRSSTPRRCLWQATVTWSSRSTSC